MAWGRLVVIIRIKAKSDELDLPTGTELGKKKTYSEGEGFGRAPPNPSPIRLNQKPKFVFLCLPKKML